MMMALAWTEMLASRDLYKLITPTGERTAALYLSRRDQTPQQLPADAATVAAICNLSSSICPDDQTPQVVG